MKGFKRTGNGPKYGRFSFGSKAGFSGSTGKTRAVRGYTQGVPAKRTALDKPAQAKSTVQRGARPGYADGGKVETVGQAFKMVKELIRRGNTPGDAAQKAARRHNVPLDTLSKGVSEKNTGGDPLLLARGGFLQGPARGALGRVAASAAVPAPAKPMMSRGANAGPIKAPVAAAPVARHHMVGRGFRRTPLVR